MSNKNPIVLGGLVPGIPHPLLCPNKNAGWLALNNGFARARQSIIDSDADLLLLYSTMWPSVIGHQIQARPEPEWVHVDELFHDLGSIPYKFRIDAPFGEKLAKAAQARGLQARTVGFGLSAQSVIRHGFKFRFHCVDLIDQGAEFLKFTVIFCAENLLGYAEHEAS